MPISEIKIDRSFVMTMADDPSNALIVRSVIDLGHNLGMTLVAEGVETKKTLNALAGLGCDIAQGYHLSRPITADAFDTWHRGSDLVAVVDQVLLPRLLDRAGSVGVDHAVGV